MERDTRISKTLSWILRHTGRWVRSDGYAIAQQVMSERQMLRMEVTSEDLERVVRTNDKQRFQIELEHGVMLIRAVQGHSVKAVKASEMMELLTSHQLDLPAFCVHGTFYKHLASILAEGLKVGANRNHIHFASVEDESRVEEIHVRRNAEVGIWLDLRRAIDAGIPFYRSRNLVIVTAGTDGVVGPEFFRSATDLCTGRALADGVDAAVAALDVLVTELFEKAAQQTTKPARSRSPRRLVNHKSPRQGVFGTFPETFEQFRKYQILISCGEDVGNQNEKE